MSNRTHAPPAAALLQGEWRGMTASDAYVPQVLAKKSFLLFVDADRKENSCSKTATSHYEDAAPATRSQGTRRAHSETLADYRSDAGETSAGRCIQIQSLQRLPVSVSWAGAIAVYQSASIPVSLCCMGVGVRSLVSGTKVHHSNSPGAWRHFNTRLVQPHTNRAPKGLSHTEFPQPSCVGGGLQLEARTGKRLLSYRTPKPPSKAMQYVYTAGFVILGTNLPILRGCCMSRVFDKHVYVLSCNRACP